LYFRYAQRAIELALEDTRIVLVTGPRQVGKTTLVRQFAGDERRYVTFDDPATYAAARQDVVQFVRQLPRAVLDEVQRVPEVLLALKRRVDEDTTPGRYLLTGSADVMALPTVTDSLAGRLEVVSLFPLSQAEVQGRPSTFLEQIFAGEVPLIEHCVLGEDLLPLVLAGGYPEALTRKTWSRRQRWLTAYADTVITRDVRDIADIERLAVMPHLMRVLAESSSQLVNYSRLGAALALNHNTTKKYIGILEHMYLVRQVPAWSSNRLKRLVSAPKVHLLDPGLLAALQNFEPPGLTEDRTAFGAILETFVFAELAKLTGWAERRIDLHHFRDKGGAHEVDFVLDDGHGVVGIEVKAAATATHRDFRGLKQLAQAAGKRFRIGLVLYDGPTTIPFGNKLFAAPLSVLWH
jgi:predicted AAA+ superfamily ATPase